MGEVIIRLMPFIIGSAVVPLQIMMVILLLSSQNRGLAKAIFLVAGMTVIRLLQGVVFGLIFSPSAGEANGKSSLVSTLLIVLGILLLITAYKQWRGEDDPDGPPPKWMTRLDSITPLKAFGAGAGLVLISGKFWVFTLSAIGVIGEAQLGLTLSIVAFLLFIILAQSLLLLIILTRLVIPGRSKSMMESISAWLTRYNRPIIIAVSLIFGLLFLVQGVSGLLK